MDENTKTSEFALLVSAGAYDPLEDEVRQRVRGFIEAILEEELRPALGRGRYVRSAEGVRGRRNGHRERQVIGTFGPETVKVPRVRLVTEDGRTSEWRSKSLRRYQRLTKKAEALIASVYLAGTNTRRVKRALFGLFDGAVSKDVVSRAWRKVKTDWEAWNARSLADEDIVRLILDGTVVKTRIDRKTTVISVLAAIGVRRDGQKVLLSIRNMGGESKAAWRMFLDDLDARGLKAPEFVIVDGAPRLEAALTELWPDTPVQRSGRRDRGRGDLASLPSRPVLYPAPFPPSPGELALLDPKCCIDRLTCFARSCEGVVDGLEQPVALAAVVRDLQAWTDVLGQWSIAREHSAPAQAGPKGIRRACLASVGGAAPEDEPQVDIIGRTDHRGIICCGRGTIGIWPNRSSRWTGFPKASATSRSWKNFPSAFSPPKSWR